MSELVRIVSEEDSLPPMPAEPALVTGYAPDRFQRFAIDAIERGENVLITAKTGSGKTFVGEYQIAKSLKRGGRVFYTTPIKSLSNQKFHDLSKLFPDASVGIMTGDIKFRPDAQIIVMTTEILRNLLFKRGSATEHVGLTALLSLEGLDAVVFDEVHYINDADRGHVWEETLMLLPPEIKLILLSATLSNPGAFVNWLAESKKRPIWLISTLWRAVPLYHNVIDSSGKLVCIMDPRENFDKDAYRAWFCARRDGLLDHDRFKEKVRDARRGGVEGPISGKTRPKAFEHQLNECLDDLYRRGNLPAIVFQFSRAECEKLAAKTAGTFIDTSDQAAVKHIWHFHLSRYSESLERSPQYHKLFDLVQRGIAFHHSGLLPFLKEVLEILFNKGYIRVLYATETFAVGINMPTKTVLFTALEKFTSEGAGKGGMRILKTAEYLQMAGRAGRRGKDDRGLVIYLPQREPLDPMDMGALLTGSVQTFCSRLSFHYDFVLKVVNGGQGAQALRDQSYWWAILQADKVRKGKELETLRQKRLTQRQVFSDEQWEACENREEIEYRIANTQNAKKKAAQRELERWKEERREHVWKPVMERFAAVRQSEKEIQAAEQALISLEQEALVPEVSRRLDVLLECGYVEKVDGECAKALEYGVRLTPQGRMASEINEGHPFLMTEFFLRMQREKSSKLPVSSLLCLLAVFLGEASKDDCPGNKSPNDLNVCQEVKDALWAIDADADHFSKIERKYHVSSDPSYWALSTEWIEPVSEWIENPDSTIGSIAAKFEVFEGNVQRALMKLAGLVEELQALATLAGDVETLHELGQARELVLRDIVIAESLYLRL